MRLQFTEEQKNKMKAQTEKHRKSFLERRKVKLQEEIGKIDSALKECK